MSEHRINVAVDNFRARPDERGVILRVFRGETVAVAIELTVGEAKGLRRLLKTAVKQIEGAPTEPPR